MTKLQLIDLTKRYANNPEPSVKNFNLTIQPGELVAFLGPSGCGKTTVLKMISGLLTPTNGDVLFNDTSVVTIPPEKREVSMVFQKPLLFPHMSVGENVGFGLKMRKQKKKDIEKKVEKMLKLVHLQGYASRRVKELSGGQEQRISLARGLVIEPRIFLLDEPLSALDASLRIEMRELIRSIQRHMQVTTICVTHDQEEAVMLADKIALMLDGSLQQYGSPEIFYEQPKTKRIAEFFGCTNFVKGVQKGKTIQTKFGTYTLPKLTEDNRDAYLVIRPEAVEISHESNALKAKVKSRIFMGTHVRYIIDVFDQEFQITLESATVYKEGDILPFKLIENRLWVVPYDKSK